jgi:hypothetical protein
VGAPPYGGQAVCGAAYTGGYAAGAGVAALGTSGYSGNPTVCAEVNVQSDHPQNANTKQDFRMGFLPTLPNLERVLLRRETTLSCGVQFFG